MLLIFFRSVDVLEAVRVYCLKLFKHDRFRNEVLRVLLIAVFTRDAAFLQLFYLFHLFDVQHEADFCGGLLRVDIELRLRLQLLLMFLNASCLLNIL